MVLVEIFIIHLSIYPSFIHSLIKKLDDFGGIVEDRSEGAGGGRSELGCETVTEQAENGKTSGNRWKEAYLKYTGKEKMAAALKG